MITRFAKGIRAYADLVAKELPINQKYTVL